MFYVLITIPFGLLHCKYCHDKLSNGYYQSECSWITCLRQSVSFTNSDAVYLNYAHTVNDKYINLITFIETREVVLHNISYANIGVIVNKI